ncbi:hypothetical protein CHARACLAT_011822 [Characodon lateralis]|uniref:Uncharacterized protein n=1 Tax=Characodon lateralis TaxID=208331 RepID=A0ABU7F283_9TELE|nr:hypothetical protein [Characodon lateralis]
MSGVSFPPQIFNVYQKVQILLSSDQSTFFHIFAELVENCKQGFLWLSFNRSYCSMKAKFVVWFTINCPVNRFSNLSWGSLQHSPEQPWTSRLLLCPCSAQFRL